MQSKIEVVRYVRPNMFLNFSYGKYDHNDNLYGVTIVFDVDYDQKEVVAKWSICNGVNFSKKEGYDVAVCSGRSETFDLELVYTNHGLVDGLVSHLMTKHSINTPLEDFEDYLKFFVRVSEFYSPTYSIYSDKEKFIATIKNLSSNLRKCINEIKLIGLSSFLHPVIPNEKILTEASQSLERAEKVL